MRRRATSFVGTAQYVSPEMLQGRPEEKASDLWALGCILYHFIAGSFPFKGTSQYHIFQKIQVYEGKMEAIGDNVYDKEALVRSKAPRFRCIVQTKSLCMSKSEN